MKRWNGWGDSSQTYPLPASGATYLSRVVGSGASIPDVRLESVLAAIPQGRLSTTQQAALGDFDLHLDPQERILHARGQSLPDWIALRSGNILTYPDGVIYPHSEQDVRAILLRATALEINLIPYGGGTSVVGHINPLPGDRPVVTLDLSALDRLLDLDATSHLATFEAGVRGPALEAQLARHGFTLGHFPQSHELSTLGGWIATHSSGQQSYHYGRIEDLFAGGHVETPQGPLDFLNVPASAAGPDLRQVFLGSEGRYGVLTRAALRIRRRPQMERFYGLFFQNWQSGVHALRQLAQDGAPVSMLRLSDPTETETTLMLSGKDRLVSLARRGLSALGYSQERCLLIYGLTGSEAAVRFAHRQVLAAGRAQRGLPAGRLIGEQWRHSRFRTPYLRNTLWETGYALDTLETALPWVALPAATQAIREAILGAIEHLSEKVLVFSHLSHVYSDGASIYTTFLFRRSSDPAETLGRWHLLKMAASAAILKHRGTISHQHGVGLDHAPYLIAEKGSQGLEILDRIGTLLDPAGILNPGKLYQAPPYHAQREG